MTRTILEDYYADTPSQFELAHKIPRRAREIQRRGNAKVHERGDKPIVVALREISERASHYEKTEEEGAEATAIEAAAAEIAAAEVSMDTAPAEAAEATPAEPAAETAPEPTPEPEPKPAPDPDDIPPPDLNARIIPEEFD